MYYNATREDPEIYCSMEDSLAMELSEKQALAELPTAVRREFETAAKTCSHIAPDLSAAADYVV
eukprot:m.366509 g.366509  ORF g.366509 m.366509 type:complete len:64 (+) comp28096_c0_seq1:647-838(+)